ncbi:hypothetical protein [Paraliomyxa miuraensis]|uniref:hypothetical protein n=1 Tax=Paraliomyxa miuraensis TaxID=376150 RepID=UPI002253A946|nr:hypothetical protein [Paraliomyxa miuraensis]MCX4243090.1 hypothetical protein [Paraliomyxa miuraensis]
MSTSTIGLDGTACERWATSSLAEHSHRLWHGGHASERPPRDARLLAAFATELARVDGPGPRVDAAIESLARHRVLATKAHVCPANGPVFLAADLLLVAARPRDAVVVVGAWSGLPFNGNARPSCLGFGLEPEALIRPATPTWTRFLRSRRDRARAGADEPGQHWLTLVPSRYQHALVYRHPIAPELARLLSDLRPELARRLADPDRCDDYPSWALRSCVALERAALAEPAIVYVDLNRVLARYLAEVLRDARHPLGELLREPARARLLGDAVHEPWFFDRDESGHARPLWLVDAELRDRRASARLPAAAIADELERGRLCPGLFPTYSALIVFGGLRCLGGQRQLEYLERFARCWRALGWTFADEGALLLAGRLVDADGRPIHAVDLALRGETVADYVHPDQPATTLWRATPQGDLVR